MQKVILHSGQEVKLILNKIMERLNNYQLALYTFSFSSFLGIMLLENFDTNFLNSIANKIKEFSNNYTSLYERVTEKLENITKSSVAGFALRGLSKLSSGASKIIEKSAKLSDSQLNANLQKASDALQSKDKTRVQNVIQRLADRYTDYISPFIDNINTLDALYNHPSQLMFDDENIYIAQNTKLAAF